jgi:hypothetical protein
MVLSLKLTVCDAIQIKSYKRLGEYLKNSGAHLKYANQLFFFCQTQFMIPLVYESSNLVIIEMLISIYLVCILQCYKEQYVSDDAASD